ncbi:MAG: oligosaccharide flippase family protein [Motiliproteus sp.]
MSIRRNLGKMGGASFVAFALNLSAVVIVSRILTPEEVGIYSVSVAVLGMAHIFRDFGVAQYLVQIKEVGTKEFREAFSVTLYSSWLLAGIVFAVREPFSIFYGHPGIAEILTILSANFLIMPFGTPLLALMNRELQFHFLATNLWLSTLVQTVVTVVCAYAGQSYLSMAWGALAALVFKVLWLNYVRPGEIFMWPTFKGLGNVLKFGSLTSLASIIKEFGTGAPDLILGRTLGFVDVAFFSRANGLKKMITARVVALIRSVYFPTFSSELRKGGDGAALYSHSMKYIVGVMAPLFAVMAIVSEPIILFLFGEQWGRAAPIATLICTYAMFVTPYTFYNLSLIAAGELKTNLWVESSIQGAQILVLICSIWLSLEHVVMLFGVVTLVQVVCVQHALNLTFNLGFIRHFKIILPSIFLIPFSSLGPIVIVLYSEEIIYSNNSFIILVMAGLLAVVGWLIGVFVTHHPIKREIEGVSAIVRRRFINDK